MRTLLLLVLLSSSTLGQGIEGWRLENGQAFKAELLEVDAESGTITFLLPKTIQIRQLDKLSQDRVIDFAERLPKVANGDFPGLYTPLPGCTVAQWSEASPRERRQHLAYLQIGSVLQKEIRQSDLVRSSAVVYETLEAVIATEKLPANVEISKAVAVILKQYADAAKKRQQQHHENRELQIQKEMQNILDL